MDPFLELVLKIHTFMRDHRGKSYSVRNLRNRLRLPPEEFHRVHMALQVLKTAGVVMKVKEARGGRGARYRHTGEALELSQVVEAIEVLRAQRKV